MDWSGATWWWVAAGVLVAAELASGTFYLLMLALGMAAGAIAAHLGFATAAQLVVAAFVDRSPVAPNAGVRRSSSFVRKLGKGFIRWAGVWLVPKVLRVQERSRGANTRSPRRSSRRLVTGECRSRRWPTFGRTPAAESQQPSAASRLWSARAD